jgi:predicted 2-oxoglutarate/Fe(II)-dependent dioxygenase YbiX
MAIEPRSTDRSGSHTAGHLAAAPGILPSAGLSPHHRPEIGDPAAPFILADQAGTRWSPLDNDIAGKPLLLLFHVAGTAADFCRDLQPFIAAHDRLLAMGCGLFALTRADGAAAVSRAWPSVPDGKPLLPLLTDATGEVFGAYGMNGISQGVAGRQTSMIVLLLNANMKIAYIGASAQDLQRITDALKRMALTRPPVPLGAHPPVLLVPLALSAADCGFLVQLWHCLDQQHGAAGHSDVDPKCVRFLHEYGRVKQYLIEEPRLQQALDAKLARRLMPEISKAFDTRAPQREAWALSCYDAAEGGMLHPHRDCASAETQHRRFTVSVVLNDTYQGGALRFREYGEQTYTLPIGTAMVFSAALLHEVLPITTGRRFALVTHLYGK